MSKLRGGIKNVKKLSIVRNKDGFLKSHIGGYIAKCIIPFDVAGPSGFEFLCATEASEA